MKDTLLVQSTIMMLQMRLHALDGALNYLSQDPNNGSAWAVVCEDWHKAEVLASQLTKVLD